MATATIPLYAGDLRAPIETEVPRAYDSACAECPLGASSYTVCHRPKGKPAPGAMLVVGDRIARGDKGGPMTGRAGALVRAAVSASDWDGPVVYDVAVRCEATQAQARDNVDACRGYLATTVARVEPDRIVVVGQTAAEALLGRRVDLRSVNRGFAWLADLDVPVLFVTPEADALTNRIRRQALFSDFAWAATVKVDPPPLDEATLLVRSEADALAAFDDLCDGFAFDVESCGTLYNADFRLLCLSAASLVDDVVWTWDPAALGDPLALAPLVKLLTDPEIPRVAHNGKFDVQAIRCAEGIEVGPLARDTMLWRKLHRGDTRVALDLCGELVGMGGHKAEAHAYVKDAVKQIRKEQRAGTFPPGLDPHAYAYARVPTDVLYRYCARDTVATARLDRWLVDRVDGGPQARVYDRVIRGAAEALTEMELLGAPVDSGALDRLDAHLTSEMRSLEGVWTAAGLENPGSAPQVAALLYDRLGLECTITTPKGKPSTSAAALEALSGQHPVVDALLRFRKLSKIHGTYCVGLRGHIREDGRVHTSYLLHGTETGRLSSKAPNLQNIPRADTPEGKMAKDCFRAPAGRRLIQLDYSQLELRVAAILSGDRAMMDIFASGEDYHMRTAQMIAPHAWGVDESMWDGLDPKDKKRYRTAAKAVNFGLLYGSGDFALSKAIGCSKAQAGKIRLAVLGQFSSLASWIRRRLDYARRQGETWTYWDGQRARRRPLPDIGSPIDKFRGTAERGSWNTAIQGTGSEYCLASIAECHRWLKADLVPADLVLTVHDSIIFEADAEAVDEVIAGATAIMEGWPSRGVRLKVDAEVGTSWGSLSAYAGPESRP